MNQKRKFDRIQRKRAKGWRKPDNTIYVGRGSKWGNPFRVGKPYRCMAWLVFMFKNTSAKHLNKIYDKGGIVCKTAHQAIRFYKIHIAKMIETSPEEYNFAELKGKNLMCWCPLDKPCHGDILLKIANI